MSNEAETRAELIDNVSPKKSKVKLYKFRPLANDTDFDRAKAILETKHFWCSQFTELNDPMEGVFYIRKENDHITYIRKNEYRLCSFSGSEAFKNPAMWGYYANGFKGVAIEIEVDKSNVKKIGYVKNSTNDNEIENILTSKLTPWEHEAEYRFLKESENNFHKIGEITGVYFGNPYGNVVNRGEIETKSKSLSKYKELKEELIKVAEGNGIKVCHVKIEGCKVKEARSDLPAKTV
jgi:hypothetical protein